MATQTRQMQITVQRRERIPVTGDGVSGYTTRPLPSTVETVEVTVDWDRLAKILGDKAVFSSGGKAQEAGGLIVVRHVRKK